MSFRDLPIRRKLALLILTASVLAVGLACVGFAIYARQLFRAHIASELTALADTLGANTAASLAFNDPKTATEMLHFLGSDQHILGAYLYDERGSLFAEYRRPGTPHTLPKPSLHQDGARFDGNSITLFRGVFLDGDKMGSIAIASDLSGSLGRLLQYLKIAMLVLAISTIVAYLVSARLLHIVSDPIVDLAQIARRVTSEENYSLRAIARGSDETGTLVRSFNQMLECVEQRDRALQTAKDELERRVEQRTADLRREVAERIRAEEEMRTAKNAAEVANRAKSEFLANMSHEIRTPLNGVIGMTDLALDTPLNAQQKECLETIKLSADSLLTVINDVLDYSKIEAGKVELEAIHFNLRDCAEETLKTFAVVADEKGLELLCDVAPDIPAVVEGDPGRLRQVLLNLLSNAIKFTPHGEVLLQVAREHAEQDDGLIRFTVADTGIGIPESKQTLVFAPFTQMDSSTTRKYGGTGLGLSISSRLVDMMGGTIWLESELANGSRFHFTARLKVVDKPAGSRPAAAMETLKALKLLVVDDHQTNRRILEEILKSWGIRTGCAENGRMALAALLSACYAGEPYSVVVTDNNMPEMDGFLLVEEIRRTPELSPVTVMMLTSAGRHGDVVRCRELGIGSYLYKPVRRHELLSALLAELGPKQASPADAGRTKADFPARPEALRILLAEDNRVNQMVATQMLEKMGHSVMLASNGHLAVLLVATRHFDLVLMDIQMPEMDGLSATQHIRKSEHTTHRHIPIIAMTAYAMKGDLERCLEAGMDGYVSKPIDMNTLEIAIIDCVRTHRDNKPASFLESPPRDTVTTGTTGCDLNKALERLGGNEKLLIDVMEIFMREGPRHIAGLRQAVAQGDANAIEKIAHTLRGELGYLEISEVSRTARTLEELAQHSQLDDAAVLSKQLEAELGEVLTSLSTALGTGTLTHAAADGADARA